MWTRDSPPTGVGRVRIVDSHTEGESTRTVLDGGPELGAGPLPARRERLRREFDTFRTGVLLEPRGSEGLVGALLVPPADRTAVTGVIFFNNAGYLSMCGHGSMGVVATLAHLGRLKAPDCRLETPAGVVSCHRSAAGDVTVENVASFRDRRSVPIDVPEWGRLTGDVAWGGNWFFLVKDSPVVPERSQIADLLALTRAVRAELVRSGVRSRDGQEIDHIEVSGPPSRPDADAKNFVLCPGGTYDRSPCGTGTSALMACRFEDGELPIGRRWRQEGILGTVFDGRLQLRDGRPIPEITGRAYITGEADLVFEAGDPFRAGLEAAAPPRASGA
jgi:4-hydroxyproline epimerase